MEKWIDGAAAAGRRRTRPSPGVGELAAVWTARHAAADDRRNAEEAPPPPRPPQRGVADVGHIRHRIPAGLGDRNRRASRAAAAGIDAGIREVDEDGKDEEEEEESIHGRATKRALVHSREEEERRSRGWAGANTGAMSGVDNLLL